MVPQPLVLCHQLPAVLDRRCTHQPIGRITGTLAAGWPPRTNSLPYLTTATNDELAGVMMCYGNPPTGGLAALVYQLTTSSRMIGLIDSMIDGVLALVISLISAASTPVAFGVAAVAAVVVFATLTAIAIRFYTEVRSTLRVLCPAPGTKLDR